MTLMLCLLSEMIKSKSIRLTALYLEKGLRIWSLTLLRFGISRLSLKTDDEFDQTNNKINKFNF